MSFIIMDPFKGQDNDVILCERHMCQVAIVPHNLTNKFQPLDITVKKPIKSFISNKHNEWFSKQVSQQLEKGIQPADSKVSLGLSQLKLMQNGSWSYTIIYIIKTRLYLMVPKLLALQRQLNQLIQC